MEEKKELRISIYIVLIILLVEIFFIFGYLLIYQDTDFHRDVTYSAYLSIGWSCYNFDLEEYGYSLSGVYNPIEDKITIIYDTPEIIIHEECHQQQNYENRFYGCDKPIRMYFNEIECILEGRKA